MILGQNHDTRSGYKQSLYKIRTSNVPSKDTYGLDMIAEKDRQTDRQQTDKQADRRTR